MSRSKGQCVPQLTHLASYMAVATLIHSGLHLINLISGKLFLNANSPLVAKAAYWSEEVRAAHKGNILHGNLWKELGPQPQRGPGWSWRGVPILCITAEL